MKNNDLGANAVATGKIGDGQVQSSDLAAGVISDDVLNPVDKGPGRDGRLERR